MHFGEMLTSRPLEKGERRKGRVRHKTPPKGSGGTAGCCATFLLAQLRFRLLCACACLQPDSCFFLLRTQLSRGLYTKIWVFPAQSFYSNCKIPLTIGFLRARQINTRQLCDVLIEL